MEIKITLNAPDLAAAIQSLADAIVAAGCIPAPVPSKIAQDPRSNEELIKEVELPLTKAEIQEARKQEDAISGELIKQSTITLETVRAKLASLSQNGKQAQVKELINKYAKKLTEIPPEKFAEVLAAAEGI